MFKKNITNIFLLFLAILPFQNLIGQSVSLQLEDLPEVHFFPEGGMYEDDVFLSLQCPNATIYYTTDGSTPRPGKSKKYRKAIKLSKTTVVRALAVRNGQRGISQAHTYFIREPETQFMLVSLAIPPKLLFDPVKGLFVKGPNVIDSIRHLPGANFWSRKEYPIHTEFFEPSGKCVFRSRTGFRLFGGMSRLFPQKSMTLVARKRYGKRRFDYPFFGKSQPKKYKFLVLRNSGSECGRTQFRDAFMTSLLDDWDLEKQAWRPAHVYINGKYWGIYNIREKINRYFIAQHQEVDKDSIDLLEHRKSLKRGSKKHYYALLDFLRNHDLSNPANYAKVQSMMDVENFILYQIAQIYFDNQDAGGNIKFWRPQRPNGRWRWILYDTDWGFALYDKEAWKNNSLAFHTEPNGPTWPNPPWSTFILRKLLENPDFRMAFARRFADELNTTFDPKSVLQQLEYFVQLYEPEMPRQWARWKYKPEVWYAHIKRMRTFAERRPNFMRQFLSDYFELGHPVKWSILITKGGQVTLNEHIHLQDTLFRAIYFERLPLSLEAEPQLGHRFLYWVINGEKIKERNITLLPEKKINSLRAVFQPYHHPLEDILIINEISCNNKKTGDWIELYNRSANTIRLQGWKLEDSKHVFEIPQVSIGGKEYLIVCQNAQKFKQYFTESYNFVGNFTFGLNKRREHIALYAPDGAVVDVVDYELPPTDTVFSLDLMLPTLNNGDPNNWEMRPGTGTPNKANTYFVESSLRAQRERWIQIGGAAGTLILGIILLILRAQKKI